MNPSRKCVLASTKSLALSISTIGRYIVKFLHLNVFLILFLAFDRVGCLPSVNVYDRFQ